MKTFSSISGVWTITSVFHLQKLIPVSEGDFILKFLEVKFGLNTTTWVTGWTHHLLSFVIYTIIILVCIIWICFILTDTFLLPLCQWLCHQPPPVPGDFAESGSGFVPATDAGLGSSLLLPGARCVSAVHPADHLQKTQVRGSCPITRDPMMLYGVSLNWCLWLEAWCHDAEVSFTPLQWSANENQPPTWRWANRRAAWGHLSRFSHVAFWRPDSALRWVSLSAWKWNHLDSQHVCNSTWNTDCALPSRRMKYLWTPYVCMFTAFGVCSPDLWMTVFKWLKLRSIHPVVLVGDLWDSDSTVPFHS